MILLDSSVWIALLTPGDDTKVVEPYLRGADVVLVPTIVLYEVYKVIRRQRSAEHADLAAGRLEEYQLVPLDHRLALLAAELSLEHGLAMADAVVYATARHHNATLITMDVDFEGLEGTEVLAGE